MKNAIPLLLGLIDTNSCAAKALASIAGNISTRDFVVVENVDFKLRQQSDNCNEIEIVRRKTKILSNLCNINLVKNPVPTAKIELSLFVQFLEKDIDDKVSC